MLRIDLLWLSAVKTQLYMDVIDKAAVHQLLQESRAVPESAVVVRRRDLPRQGVSRLHPKSRFSSIILRTRLAVFFEINTI